MFKTPVLTLTKKQQKLSLSAKKTKTKETVRNVLVSPYSKYWPLISNWHYETIKQVLNQYLPKLLPEKIKIPWTELKKIRKTERKKFRELYASGFDGPDCPKQNSEDRDGLVLGINDVTKALETEKVRSVLITDDVVPRLMVEHVIDQAVLLGIPVLVVPGLRIILKEKCGISSVSVAFTDSPRYRIVQNSIENISRYFPIPENHINFNRTQKITDDSIIIIEDSIVDDISKTILGDTTNVSVDTQIGQTERKTLDGEGKPGITEFVESVYLIRTGDKRVFIPERSSEETQKDKMGVDSTSFLSFSNDTPLRINKKYLSLQVKKTKGDTNRSKRKIEASKEKSRQKGTNKKFKKDTTM